MDNRLEAEGAADRVIEDELGVVVGVLPASALPWYAILVLPVLFTAGMTLFDSLDGIFMCVLRDADVG